jgi:hypothetical protein
LHSSPKPDVSEPLNRHAGSRNLNTSPEALQKSGLFLCIVNYVRMYNLPVL